ncbi:hypothetical protein IFM89_019882 [Coptis chinensis]|uniref:Serine protease n=1 Tax=Coptis chinensis TaxID=261450 RepID=A0A835LN58_9MAGN|nr:hypothetical protein IFM89_019882 [Coptis chinensis]
MGFDLEKFFQDHKRSIVRVKCHVKELTDEGEEKISKSFGTGFVINNKGYVVTAAHTVPFKSTNKGLSYLEDGTTYETVAVSDDNYRGAMEVNRDNSADILILRPINKHFRNSFIFQPVKFFKVEKMRYQDSHLLIPLSHLNAGHGASGSPLFTRDGLVIGVVLDQMEDFNLALSLNSLASLISEYIPRARKRKAVAAPSPQPHKVLQVSKLDGPSTRRRERRAFHAALRWSVERPAILHQVDSILDKEDFTLEELLDEEGILQECKTRNSRLINFLRDRAQVEQLLRYIVEEASVDAESKRVFKYDTLTSLRTIYVLFPAQKTFPFVACEIFTCEIDVILKTLVEEDELMNLLFSFLEPKHCYSTMLAGYFSKVAVCLMLRKMIQIISYIEANQDVLRRLVDLIGITPIMEVLVRLVCADGHVDTTSMDVMPWLANSNLLEMLVDKLNPSNSPEVHANAAIALCAISQNAPALASKLSTPSFVAMILANALEDSQSRSGLVHSLSVCISLMDRKSLASPLLHSVRNQHFYESPITENPETIIAMLPKLGDFLMLLNVSSDENILSTAYGVLRPPLGKHCLKIVEFFAVLLRTQNELAEKELLCVGAIKRILDLFFEYPFHNALNHLAEGIIKSCLESKNSCVVDHLFQECNVAENFLQTDCHAILSSNANQVVKLATL